MTTLVQEIESRRAFRGLSAEPIPEDVVQRLFQAATFAPSCYNNQPWRFVAVRDPAILDAVKAQLSEGNVWAKTAPLIILACTKPSLDCRLDEGRDYSFFDLGLATMNLMLQADHEGLVAHPIAGFNPKKTKTACKVPSDFVVVSLIICGKRGENPALADWQVEREKGARQRKPITENCFHDTWQGTE
jgi:nitroreductase